MEKESSTTVGWVVTGLLAAMLFCLCAVLSAGSVALGTAWYVQKAITEQSFPGLDSLPPQATPVEFPEEPTPVPPQAKRMLDELMRVDIPEADPIEIAVRLMGITKPPRVVATQAMPIPVGAVEPFWATNVDTTENFRITAELAYASEHVYFWIERGVEYDPSDVEAVVEEFEQKAYPTNRSFFGSEWTPGVDGDPHLYILFARNLGDSIAGYYASSDEYPPQVHEYSNAHEMFYLNADNLSLWEEFTDSVLAHEFQHMIQWNFDANEESWLNEGFSELSAHLNGYDVGGVDYAFLSNPDVPLTFWPSEPGTASAHYGQAYLFVAYFLERFGPEVTTALTANRANGLVSIDETLAALDLRHPDTGEILSADDVFRDWAVALMQDQGLGGERYSLESSNLTTSVRLTEAINDCPTEALTRQVNQYGLDYISIRCQEDHTLIIDGSSLAKIVPADPHSGDYAVWSNKGDESNMTLSRSFDFRSVQGDLILEYWLWYDLEEDYDYLYLETSADGGETWQILETPSGTSEDPSGNSYGWAYNGYSGGGSEPEWIRETVDLSSFAGEEVILRFEYITDAAVNGEGLLLDDIVIEAIDYQEDFELGAGGWTPDGFVRIFNRLPQTYRLILVERGDQTRVSEITLDEDRHAEVPLLFSGDIDEVILIVTGTTRHTWQPAPYRLQIVP